MTLPVRLHAAKALGRIGDSRAFAPLCVALRDNHASVRRRAVTALGQMHDERVISEVLRMLQQDRTLESEVAQCLANFVTPRAAYILMRAATQLERQPAKYSIIERLGQQLTPLLVFLLKYRAESWQFTIIRWIGRVGDGGAIPTLRTLSTDTRASIQRAAYIALGDVQYRQYQHWVPKATTAEPAQM